MQPKQTSAPSQAIGSLFVEETPARSAWPRDGHYTTRHVLVTFPARPIIALRQQGSGIDTLHVWAYPSIGGAPVLLGTAALGGVRTEVASQGPSRHRRSCTLRCGRDGPHQVGVNQAGKSSSL